MRYMRCIGGTLSGPRLEAARRTSESAYIAICKRIIRSIFPSYSSASSAARSLASASAFCFTCTSSCILLSASILRIEFSRSNVILSPSSLRALSTIFSHSSCDHEHQDTLGADRMPSLICFLKDDSIISPSSRSARSVGLYLGLSYVQ
jgi:hypothetical protein